MQTNTQDISCSIVRVWKGAHDAAGTRDDWNDAADILEVAFDEINSLIYKIETFASKWETARNNS